MKTELQQKLLEKYPEFFTNKKIYTGKNSIEEDIQHLLKQKEIVEPIQFGFEVGDGWYMLLDQLMEEIKQHILNVNLININKLNPIFWKLQYWFRRYKNTRFIGDWIYLYAPRKKYTPLIITISQIKEKFGGLRFYYYGGDDAIDGMVGLAESLSYIICETCGTTINVGRTTRAWQITICEDCYRKNPKIKDYDWKPND